MHSLEGESTNTWQALLMSTTVVVSSKDHRGGTGETVQEVRGKPAYSKLRLFELGCNLTAALLGG